MQLTQSDIEKIKEEIEHRKIVVRKEALEDVKDCEGTGRFEREF